MCGCPSPDVRGVAAGRGKGRGAAGEDVNNALQGMRLEKRSWGFKGICVCHTNQEVSLHSEANLNRRPRAERG